MMGRKTSGAGRKKNVGKAKDTKEIKEAKERKENADANKNEKENQKELDEKELEKKTEDKPATAFSSLSAVSPSASGSGIKQPSYSSAIDEAADFIRRHTEIIEPLQKEKALSWWEMNTTGKEEAFERYAELETKIRTLYSNRDEYEFVKRLRQGIKKAGEKKEKEKEIEKIHRQIEILYLSYLGNQLDPSLIAEIVALEAEVEKAFNTHRAVIRGTEKSDNELLEILSKSTDSEECKEAYLASKQVGRHVSPLIERLVELRNRGAHLLGFPDYFNMSLTLQEIDERWLMDTLNTLDKELSAEYDVLKEDIDCRMAERFGKKKEELMPWHYANPFFQELPPDKEIDLDSFYYGKDIEKLTLEFYRRLGIDIQPVLSKSDLYERKGKCQHAFCISISAPEDVRVLCNIKPTSRWAGTMLHEFGHASYDMLQLKDMPYLLRSPAHTMSTEAIAMMMERQTLRPEWFTDFLGVSSEQAASITSHLQKRSISQRLLFTRWVLVMVNFEKMLYSSGSADGAAILNKSLNKIWWDLVEKYQKLKRIPGRDEPDWASKIHIAVAPVYYHNYQLGDMYASQILAFIENEVLKGAIPLIFGGPEVGSYLREKIFTQGALRDWNATLEYATGKKLETAAFVREIKKGFKNL